MSDTLYDQLGGKPCLEEVHRIFYDKLMSHPWLKQYFVGRKREHQESQQTDFMTGLFGGPQIYGGRMPKSAHQHLFITEEVFQLRHDMLADALDEAGVPPDLKARWLGHDLKIKYALVKSDLSECKPRYPTDTIIAPAKP